MTHLYRPALFSWIPELSAKAKRRRFSAAEKLRILKEADACTKPGEQGALLRNRPTKGVW